LGGGGLGRPSGVVYAISSDGVLHVMGLQSGKDLQKPAPFVPANSRWSDPIAVGTMLYTSTSGGCGGAPNAVWAIDLESESKPVVSWKGDAPLLGSLAFTTAGTLVGVTASGIVTLDAKTLQPNGSFNAARLNSEFVTGPTIFKHGEREIVAAGLKDGRMLLVEAAGIDPSGGRPSYSDTNSEPAVATDSLATWQDAATGTQSILVPTERSVAALRVDEGRGVAMVRPQWRASDLAGPGTPLIVNGVIFVLERGSTAVLHAYDGTTGKELWTSGKTMTAAAAPGSFWSAFGQIYVGTTDGTLYAFGFDDERR
jgi:hypothetical protein